MAADRPPFHLAFPVTDLAATRAFMVEVLGCGVGRESERWIDFDLQGHQVTAHRVEAAEAVPATNPVSGHAIPVRHFGLVLSWEDWHALVERLRAAAVPFAVAPHIRFPGEPGEQATLFVVEPGGGNYIEFKAFRDPQRLFAREQVMDRRAHWEQVYRDKAPEAVSWFQPDPALSRQLIEATGIGTDAAVIDVGGGASRLVDCLLEAGYRDVSVLDIAPSALAHARKRLGEAAKAVSWIEADITRFAPPKRYALWHDRAVFHFLTEAQDRERYRQAVLEGLAPGGHLIIAAFALDGPTRCSGLDIVRYDSEGLQRVLGPAFRLRDSVHEIHHTPGGGEQKFGYHWFQRIS